MRIVSGGQTGVDRAALDVAIARGLPYGGWCPRGGWAEDMPTPPGLLAHYPLLRETPSADPAQRTAWNIRDADATLVLVDDGDISVSPGTALARRLAEESGRPLLIAGLHERDALLCAAGWLAMQRNLPGRNFALGIGGPRESEAPGIYQRAKSFLHALLEQAAPAGADA